MSPHTVTPVIVRLSGLPSTIAGEFASALCGEPLTAWSRTKEEVREEREQLTERLYRAFQGASPERRRVLLALKRDCFNGRSLARYLEPGKTAVLEESEIATLSRIALLEEKAKSTWQELERAYVLQRAQERRCLAKLAADPAFVRGVALGSVSLAGNLERLGTTDPEAFGHRERILERGLLRYVSRAALKLSPFSSLTRVALGHSHRDSEVDLRLLGEGWTERSLARMKRSVLEQYGQVLLHYPPLRQTLRVLRNDSLEEVAPDRYRFVRPGIWQEDETGQFTYVKPALVQVGLRGDLNTRILRKVSQGAATYQRLQEELEAEFNLHDDPFVRQTLDRFLDLGVLLFDLPWKSDDLHAEASILQFLQGFGEDERLRRIGDELESLVSLETSYSRVGSPAEAVAAVEESEKAAERIWRMIVDLAGLPDRIRYEPAERSPVHEDVLLTQSPGSGERIVAELSQTMLEKALASVRPMVRLASVMDHNFDFLHALSALAGQRWPGRSEVPFLDLFAAAQPLWREFTEFERRLRSDRAPRSKSFNPMRLAAVDELTRHREEVVAHLRGCVEIQDGEKHLLSEKLEAFIDRIPLPYSADRDACLFLQPADSHCRRWMLNGMFESGRYHSRYTSIMDERSREEICSHYQARAKFRADGEDLEVVEVLCPGGRTVNVHAAQTPRVIVIPGEFSSLPDERLLRLRDLRVQLQAPSGLPFLTDGAGRRLLPTYLGTTVLRFMPLPLKFLALFGPGQMEAFIPESRAEMGPELGIAPRLLIGNVILRRKRWLMQRDTLLRALAGNSEAESFVSFNRWRTALGLPDRFFLARREGEDFTRGKYKPQFIDATSPLFCTLLRSLLDLGPDLIGFDELLPVPEEAPRDGAGVPWSFEVQLDSVAMNDHWKVPLSTGEPSCAHSSNISLNPALSLRSLSKEVR